MDGGVDMESLLNAQNYTCKLYHKLANFKTQYGWANMMRVGWIH